MVSEVGTLTLLRTFLNKSTPPLRSLPSEVKNLFHCLALSGLFLFLWDHGDLRRALKTFETIIFNILVLCPDSKTLIHLEGYEVNDRIKI